MRWRIWALILFLLAPAIPLWRTMLHGESIGPFDQIRTMAPWNGPRPERPWDVLQADGVLQFYGWRELVFRSWSRGDLPAWNPYELCGTPLLANSQSAALYPPHILCGLLRIPTPIAIVILAWLHLVLAGVGTAFLARELGASRAGAVLGGLSFMLCQFMLAWTALPSVITTVAWIPWALGFLMITVRKQGDRVGPIGLAISVAMMILGGHLQFSAYGLMAIFIFGLIELANNRKGVIKAILPTVAGLLISMPHLLPVLEFGSRSHRQNQPTQEGYHAYVRSALQPYELASLISPDLLGKPFERATPDSEFSTYWPALVKTGGNYAESAISIGPLVIVLLLVAAAGRVAFQSVAAPIVVGIVSLLLALGTPLNRLLYFWVPGWSATGSPARVSVLFVLCASLIAAQAVKPVRQMNALKTTGWAALLLIGICAIVRLMIAQPAPEQVDSSAWNLFVIGTFASGLIPLIGAMLVSCAVIYLMLCDASQIKSPYIVFAPLIVACLLSAPQIVPTGRPLERVIQPTSKRIAIVNDRWSLVGTPMATLPPNTPALFGIRDTGGYDSIIDRDTVALLRESIGQDPAPIENGNMMFVKPGANPRKLSDMGTQEIWSAKPIDGLGSAKMNGSLFVYSTGSQGIIEPEQGAATVISQRPGFYHISTDKVKKLSIKERNLPGWNVKVDGKTEKVVRGKWISIEALPPGVHDIHLQYVPPGFYFGLGLSVLGLLALIPYAKPCKSV